MKGAAVPGRILIALDLDGTSVVYSPRLEMDGDLASYLASVRETGVSWVMNSDRFTDTMADIAALLPPHQQPEGLLSCQRFIHLRDVSGAYLPVRSWNQEQVKSHNLLWEAISPFFPDWRSMVESRFDIIESVVNDMVFAFMVAPEETPELRRMMHDFIQPWPEAQISGNHDWTFILHADFSKARVLKKTAELLDIPLDRVIAVGDGINDISMLDGSEVRMVGCPCNASPEVLSAVRAAGGFIADLPEAGGTMQVIRHYISGLMRS